MEASPHNVKRWIIYQNPEFQSAGLFSAAATTLVATHSTFAPLERVQLLLQNQKAIQKAGRLPVLYKGLTDCFRRVVKEEGFTSLWRGNSATIIRCVPGLALNLRFNSFFNWAFDVKNEKYPLWKLAAHNIAAGSAAGVSSLAVIHPINYVRTRLANDSKFKWGKTHREFTGVVDVMKKTLSTDGVAGMYRGYNYASTRVALTHGMYFGLYNTLQHKDVKQDTVLLAMLGGGCTAVTFATYPLDTLSKRMMMTSGQSHNFNGSYDAFRRIVKMEGSRRLFSGAGAHLLFMATGGLLLFGVEESLTLFVACA